MAKIPPGYIISQMTDGTRILVPEFMVSAADAAFDAHQSKITLDVENAPGGPLKTHGLPCNLINAVPIMAPVDPSLTDRERLALYAEAKALQDKFGISLKDACHRLYMAEIAKLETIDTAHKGYVSLRNRIDKTISHEIFPPIEAIDKGEADDMILPHGRWPPAE